MDCEFVTQDGGIACRRCGYTYHGPTKPRRNCRPSPPTPGVSGDAIKHLAHAATLTDAAGRLGVTLDDVKPYVGAAPPVYGPGYDTRDSDEVAWILERLCGPCDANKNNRCTAGRCSRHSSRMPLEIMATIGTEGCPRWKW